VDMHCLDYCPLFAGVRISVLPVCTQSSTINFQQRLTMDTIADGSTSVDRLNFMLRCELAAVDAYDRAAVILGDAVIPELGENRDCHFLRSQLLRKSVADLDGEPTVSSGAWGDLATAATTGSSAPDRADVLAILTTGEDRCLADYRSMLMTADDRVRPIIARDMLPAQESTHRRIRLLNSTAITSASAFPHLSH
jgi:hypothetical protein